MSKKRIAAKKPSEKMSNYSYDDLHDLEDLDATYCEEARGRSAQGTTQPKDGVSFLNANKKSDGQTDEIENAHASMTNEDNSDEVADLVELLLKCIAKKKSQNINGSIEKAASAIMEESWKKEIAAINEEQQKRRDLVNKLKALSTSFTQQDAQSHKKTDVLEGRELDHSFNSSSLIKSSSSEEKSTASDESFDFCDDYEVIDESNEDKKTIASDKSSDLSDDIDKSSDKSRDFGDDEIESEKLAEPTENEVDDQESISSDKDSVFRDSVESVKLFESTESQVKQPNEIANYDEKQVEEQGSAEESARNPESVATLNDEQSNAVTTENGDDEAKSVEETRRAVKPAETLNPKKQSKKNIEEDDDDKKSEQQKGDMGHYLAYILNQQPTLASLDKDPLEDYRRLEVSGTSTPDEMRILCSAMSQVRYDHATKRFTELLMIINNLEDTIKADMPECHATKMYSEVLGEYRKRCAITHDYLHAENAILDNIATIYKNMYNECNFLRLQVAVEKIAKQDLEAKETEMDMKFSERLGSKYEKELSELRELNDNLLRENTEMAENLDHMLCKLSHEQEEKIEIYNTKYRKMLADISHRYDVSESERKILAKQLDRTKLELRTTQAADVTMKEENADLRNKLNSVTKSLNAYKLAHQQAAEERDDYVKTLTSKVDSLQGLLLQLRNTEKLIAKDHQEERDALVKRNKTLLENYNKIKRKYESTSTDNDELNSELKNLCNLTEDLGKKNMELQTEVNELKAYKDQCLEYEQHLNRLMADESGYLNQIEMLTQELAIYE